MNHILKAILLGILLWILIFVEVSIFKIGLGFIGVAGTIIHYVFLIVFTVLTASLYYKWAKKTAMNGFLLGVLFILVGTILDLAITAPLFTGYSAFYSQWNLWVGFAIVILTAGIYQIVRK